MLYEFGGDAAAVRMFRTAIAEKADIQATTTIAWILATTSDESLRNGHEALQLIQPIAKQAGDDPLILSALAAANAEVGRYGEAVQAAERAVALVRSSGDNATGALLEKRLVNYRANRPWRQ